VPGKRGGIICLREESRKGKDLDAIITQGEMPPESAHAEPQVGSVFYTAGSSAAVVRR